MLTVSLPARIIADLAAILLANGDPVLLGINGSDVRVASPLNAKILTAGVVVEHIAANVLGGPLSICTCEVGAESAWEELLIEGGGAGLLELGSDRFVDLAAVRVVRRHDDGVLWPGGKVLGEFSGYTVAIDDYAVLLLAHGDA